MLLRDLLWLTMMNNIMLPEDAGALLRLLVRGCFMSACRRPTAKRLLLNSSKK